MDFIFALDYKSNIIWILKIIKLLLIINIYLHKYNNTLCNQPIGYKAF